MALVFSCRLVAAEKEGKVVVVGGSLLNKPNMGREVQPLAQTICLLGLNT